MTGVAAQVVETHLLIIGSAFKRTNDQTCLCKLIIKYGIVVVALWHAMTRR